MKSIIIDMDGTLADNNHRLHHIEKDPPDWDAYNALMPKDPLNLWCRRIMEHFSSTHYVLIVTGRMQSVDIEGWTLKWLNQHDVPYNRIFFRDDEDFRSDVVVKQEIYEKVIKLEYDIDFIIDDRPRVVDMWRKQGLVCLQPNFNGY